MSHASTHTHKHLLIMVFSFLISAEYVKDTYLLSDYWLWYFGLLLCSWNKQILIASNCLAPKYPGKTSHVLVLSHIFSCSRVSCSFSLLSSFGCMVNWLNWVASLILYKIQIISLVPFIVHLCGSMCLFCSVTIICNFILCFFHEAKQVLFHFTYFYIVPHMFFLVKNMTY